MTEKEKKIAELKQHMSYLAFADRLSREDEKAMEKISAEIKELNKDREGWVVECSYKETKYFGDSKFYLTDDKHLCFSDDVTCFESEEEAKQYLSEAKLEPERYNIRIYYYGNK